MKSPASVAELTALGRVRLSEHFFMREMLYSEVANFHGLSNMPEDADLAIEVARKFCALILEPLHRAFGGIAVRSAYRSPTVNDFCHQRSGKGDFSYFCSENRFNYARHIWDRRDDAGFLGATATIVVPSYIEHFERTRDCRPLAWWIRDHIEHYAELAFYPRLCSFNIRWYEGLSEQQITWVDPPHRETITKAGMTNFDGDHSALYRDVIRGR
jgi:hypothetical protein